MSEKVRSSDNEYTFKTEIKQLLNILIHSLYSEREIFLRELISNASDALSQMAYLMLTQREVLNPELPLEIRIDIDKDEGIITVRDTGIGMNKDEMIQNLGTIAQSGARAFLEAAEKQKSNLSDIIGQFGVGFYSVFMVADWVRVVSRSYRINDVAAAWFAKGDDHFIVEDATKEERGTEVQIKLKQDALEFADEYKLREVIKKHSDFVNYPIYLGDEEKPVNQQSAIWRRRSDEIKKDEYIEFYRHLTLDYQEPITYLHIHTDAPIQLYALLFIPVSPERSFLSLRKEDGLKLYVRKVLIQEYTTEMLPNYFRFIQGVIDSEDLPLNVSREMLQASPLTSRIKRILTRQVIGELNRLAIESPESYDKFWQAYGVYIREGIATDHEFRDDLVKLVRFRTSKYPSVVSSLADYVGRMKPEQRRIYYLLADNEISAENSPHLDYFKQHDIEVIFFTHPLDAMMLVELRNFEGFELENIASAEVQLPEDDSKRKEDKMESDKLSTDQNKLLNLMSDVLRNEIEDVRISRTLTNSVARLVDKEGSITQEIQRLYKLTGKAFDEPKKILEVNPNHKLFKLLVDQMNRTTDNEMIKLIIKQIYLDARLIEGLETNPIEFVSNTENILLSMLESGNYAANTGDE